MSDDQREMRRFPRLEAQQAVLVKKLDAEGAEKIVPTKTIAIGGCSLVTDEPLGTGTNVELLIAVDQTVVSAWGRVVYETTAIDGRIENGIEFSRLDDRAAHAIHRLFIRKPEER